MPEEDKKMVPIDTSGPDTTIDIEETKDEAVVEHRKRRNKKHGYNGTDKTFENERETKLEEKKDDDNFRGLQ